MRLIRKVSSKRDGKVENAEPRTPPPFYLWIGMRQNEIDTLEIDQSASYFDREMRVIRSHRAPTRFHLVTFRKGVLFIFILLLGGTVAVNEMVSSITVEAQSPVWVEPVPSSVDEASTLRGETDPEIEKLVEKRAIKATISASSRKAARTEPSRIETVIAFATAQIGKPYVWGAAGPHAWDCSGLTLRAYAQVGITLGHYTGWQMSAGKPVHRNDMQRGDLLFPSAGHVGIYLGDNKILHASAEGRVMIDNVWAVYTVRRLI